MAVDDHGLEVLKKSGRDVGGSPKSDYALQVWIMNPGSGGGGGGGLSMKSGIVLNSSFAGSPKKYDVVFTTPFPDNEFSVVVTGEDSRSFTVESKSASGFTINANAATALTGKVFWQAAVVGES